MLRFGASNAQIWKGKLSIRNWNGSPLGEGGDQLFFGTGATGLTAGQIGPSASSIRPDSAPARTAPESYATGEIVAVPEPGSTALLFTGLAVLVPRRRRR